MLSDEAKPARYDPLGTASRTAGDDGADGFTGTGAFGFFGPFGGPSGPGRFGGPAGDGLGGSGGFEDIRVDSGDVDEVFASLFGGRGGRRGGAFGGFAARGADHEAQLGLTLEEAAVGGRRSVTLADGRSPAVDVPAAVGDGQWIRIRGGGGRGRGGGPAGDLVLRVRVAPHPRLRLDGRDPHVDVPVAPWEAALGATVEIPTLEGAANVKVPAGSSSGRKLRLRGHGFPGVRGGRGDLYATVRIVAPRRPGGRERELFEELARTSALDPRERA